MSFSEYVDQCKRLVVKSMSDLGLSTPAVLDWAEPPERSLGDLSFRVAFQISRSAGKRPFEVSREISHRSNEILGNAPELFPLVQKAEPHAAGFLNFWIKKENFNKAVVTSAQQLEYGKRSLGKDRTVIVEHTAVNPNKAIHIGHLRNVAIGDCVARILRFTGHNVTVLNYIDDSGLQVADVIVGMLHLGIPAEPASGIKYDHYVGDEIYVKVNRAYEVDPSLAQKRNQVLRAIERHDKEIWGKTVEITGRIILEQLKTCWRFGAYYNLLVYESDIIASGLWNEVFEELKRKGIAKYEQEGKLKGCWIVSLQGEAEGEDKVLVRSDGTATYVAKDMPYAALKVGLIADRFSYSKYIKQPNGDELWRTMSGEGPKENIHPPWGADESITVIGSEQSRLQRIIKHVLQQLAGTSLEERYIHLSYSRTSLSSKTLGMLNKQATNNNHAEEITKETIITMSGRKGTYINADDVIDLVKGKALSETRKRNPETKDEAWLSDVSEKLAVAAIRFSLLRQDLDKMIIFDLEDALQMLGETGPYMLYSYARAMSIISKLGNERNQIIENPKKIDDSETELVMQLSKFDIALDKSVRMLAPKWIAHYSFELCEAFNTFYERNRVLQESDENSRAFRIGLVLAFTTVLRNALDLLGIEPLERI